MALGVGVETIHNNFTLQVNSKHRNADERPVNLDLQNTSFSLATANGQKVPYIDTKHRNGCGASVPGAK